MIYYRLKCYLTQIQIHLLQTGLVRDGKGTTGYMYPGPLFP